MSEKSQYDSSSDANTSDGLHAESALNDQVLSAADSAAIIAEKEDQRQQLQNDVEAFLASGGSITAIDKNVVADPPKRPQSSYGSQPI